MAFFGLFWGSRITPEDEKRASQQNAMPSPGGAHPAPITGHKASIETHTTHKDQSTMRGDDQSLVWMEWTSYSAEPV